MDLIRGLHNIKPYHKGCILTIGNFDGFHKGHQLLISKLNQKKHIYKLPIVVMIFEPQPHEYLSKIVSIRLTRLRDKIQYLSDAGVDVVLCITFDHQLASTEASSFIQNVLISKLRISFICVGNDFRFGSCRQGNVDLLQAMGESLGFQVIQADTCIDKNGQKISSTAVRTALMEDRIIDAELLMGHSYCISGKVIHGNELGRIIGFPTANISLQGKKLPIHGVYAVKVYGIHHFSSLPGIANIGIRPTITGTFQQQLEVHVLNLSMNLYLYHIKVIVLKKIRNEQYFNSIKELKNQIQNDVAEVNNYFKNILKI